MQSAGITYPAPVFCTLIRPETPSAPGRDSQRNDQNTGRQSTSVIVGTCYCLVFLSFCLPDTIRTSLNVMLLAFPVGPTPNNALQCKYYRNNPSFTTFAQGPRVQCPFGPAEAGS